MPRPSRGVQSALAVMCLVVLVGTLSIATAMPVKARGQRVNTQRLKHRPSIEAWTPSSRSAPPYVPPPGFKYNTKGGPVEGKINVHLVPHSHDDTGWQVTVDQYFFNDVYYILDTVVERLNEDPNRKFIFVEIGFFARWWDQKTDEIKDLTRKLVNNKQLEFINGGWCMHDEGSPFYVEMVDQTTRGHQFLKREFGDHAVPRGTWQIDPFGHSNTQAWLLSADAGMESLYFGRMDYQDFNVRKNESKLEWLWQGSQSLPDKLTFTGEFYGSGNAGYGSWFDFNTNGNLQVQDDPTLHDYNVDLFIDQFVQDALLQAKHTRTEHQMWACGSDFEYQNADHWYRNLDKLIHYINQNGTINAFYSTPSLYTDAKKAAKLTWEVRQDDIFPLADGAHKYWTGYFTSRPALKRQIRTASNLLNSARQLEVFSGVTAKEVPETLNVHSPQVGQSWTDSLEGGIGVSTHHDGMSGTERESVSNDYSQRISEGAVRAERGVGEALRSLLGVGKDVDFEHCNCNSMGGASGCLNLSICAATTDEDSFGVVAWNPRGTTASHWMRVPVVVDEGGNSSWAVTAHGPDAAVPSQLVPIDSITKGLPLLYINHFGLSPAESAAAEKALANKATHILIFEAEMPAVGYRVYSARRVGAGSNGAGSMSSVTHPPKSKEPFVVSNDVYTATFDGETGMMTSLKNVISNVETDLSLQWGWYNSSVGGCTAGVPKDEACDGQSSGAYIFRPNTSTVWPCGAEPPKTELVRGDLVTEVRQVYSDWASHVIRFYTGLPVVEVEWTAGPIPIDAAWLPGGNNTEWGKEVILKYTSGLQSNKTFWTDSNGREMVKRVRNARGPSYPPLDVNEPVAGNYYPVNSMMSIVDSGAGARMSITTDASAGGSSLQDGEMELMVHRRLFADDNRGVQEPLNETMCGCNDLGADPGTMGDHSMCHCAGLTIRGRHWLSLDSVDEALQTGRVAIESLNFGPLLSFVRGSRGLASLVSSKRLSASVVSESLPPNVKLMTLTSNYGSGNRQGVLLRLAHLYSVGEHPSFSAPATVDLQKVFGMSGLEIKSAEEWSLTGNKKLNTPVSAVDEWQREGGEPEYPAGKRVPYDASSMTVVLRPMEIRTFFAEF